MTGLGTGIQSDTAPACASISTRFDSQALATPQSLAVRAGELSLRYGELRQRVCGASAALLAAGIGPDEPVALLLPRGIDSLVAMLAIVRIGACYLPLDPEAPRARQRHMLDETDCRWIVSGAEADSELLEGDRRWLAVEDLRQYDAIEIPVTPRAAQDRFCILYTSGSTGLPKGVELSQLNVLNCLDWMQHEYRLGNADRMLHKTPTTFDVSMYELFWPLMAGAGIVMAEPQGHRDAAYLAELIAAQGITAAHFVPSMLAAFLEEPAARGCSTLRQVFAAGEALPYALTQRFYERLPDACLHNLYGPTEGGVVSYWPCPMREAQGRVPIGRAVANTRLYVLDEQQRPVAPGEEGELYIGGVQVARGYVGRPDLTAQRFIQHASLGRLYRTGDLAREREGGVFDYLGRRDHQVKLRGVRIELGEIESRLATHPGVVEAVAGVREMQAGDARLIVWYQPRQDAPPDEAALREFLAGHFAAAMLPQHVVALDTLPHLPNGKIDRKALPDPASVARAPQPRSGNELQQRLIGIWEAVLVTTGIGLEQRFFEIGGSSLLALRVMAQLREALGRRVPLAKFFAAPTVASFAAMLERDYAAQVAQWLHSSPLPLAGEGGAEAPREGLLAKSQKPLTPAPLPQAGEGKAIAAQAEDIAIVGMACRVPGADDLDSFWDVVASGREGLRELSEAELDAAGVPPELRADPAYVRRAAPLADAYCFDAAFFGYAPREAELTDPQQRVLLECAWQALEHAGIAPHGANVGVYVGIAHNQYFDRSLATYDDLRLGNDGFQTLLASDKDYAATRIAYKLDLRGPAIGLQTACSTSGVALHLAVQALRSGDCEAAIVGGARVNVPDTAGYLHVDGGPQAADGRVRPFDARASGMVLGSGVACLVLKPLSRALADGERVYAVIKGTAINNDGAHKAAYTAPAEDGQVEVIRAALAAAGVAPDSIGYVEAHGTGTALGDPIEVAALSRAYESAERIALGSVKANVGHLDAAAGAIGAIKAALALDRKQLPPLANFEQPNPECDFERTPFFIDTKLQDWPSETPRRAALSSFGFGGTNFHGVLEEAPPQVSTPPTRAYALLRLSAATDTALREQAARLADFLRRHPDSNLADVAYTLDRGRARLSRRASIVAADAAQAIERLSQIEASGPATAAPSLVFMFPGQGAQHVGMGRELYQREPLFREIVDHCAARLQPALGRDLRAVLYPAEGSDTEAAVALLRTTEYAQPAIFSISYATARLWQSWGLKPDAMVGHSLGEFVAATLAGVFTLDDALAIIARRGQMMQSMPRGGMLAVRLSEADAQPYLTGGVTLGGVNSPGLVVLSGPNEALARVEAELKSREIGVSPLHTSHAFHSPMMDPLVGPFADVVAGYSRGRCEAALISTLSGGWVHDDDLASPYHWARQWDPLESTCRHASLSIL